MENKEGAYPLTVWNNLLSFGDDLTDPLIQQQKKIKCKARVKYLKLLLSP